MPSSVTLPKITHSEAFIVLALHYLSKKASLPDDLFDANNQTEIGQRILSLFPNQPALDNFQKQSSKPSTLFDKAIIISILFRGLFVTTVQRLTHKQLDTYFLSRFKQAMEEITRLILNGATINNAFAQCSKDYGVLLTANQKDFAPYIVATLMQQKNLSAEDARFQDIGPILMPFEDCWHQKGLNNFLEAIKDKPSSLSFFDLKPLCEFLNIALTLDETPISEGQHPLWVTSTEDGFSVSLDNDAYTSAFNKQFASYQLRSNYLDPDKEEVLAEKYLLLPVFIEYSRALETGEDDLSFRIIAHRLEENFHANRMGSVCAPISIRSKSILIDDEYIEKKYLVSSYSDLIREHFFKQQTIISLENTDFLNDWKSVHVKGDEDKLCQRYYETFKARLYQDFRAAYVIYYKALMEYLIESILETKEILSIEAQKPLSEFITRLKAEKTLSEADKLMWISLIEQLLILMRNGVENIELLDRALNRFKRLSKEFSIRKPSGFFAHSLSHQKSRIGQILQHLTGELEKHLPLISMLDRLKPYCLALDGEWARCEQGDLLQTQEDIMALVKKKKCLEEFFGRTPVTVCVKQIQGVNLYQIELQNVSFKVLKSLLDTRRAEEIQYPTQEQDETYRYNKSN